jgi:hypothetical protein
MKTEELRSLQAPLKERYRERPETALVYPQGRGTDRDEYFMQSWNWQGAC